jgi:hypothetical protein
MADKENQNQFQNKDELLHNKDAKFAPGIQVSCPYLLCNYKNSQFQQAGRFPSGNL